MIINGMKIVEYCMANPWLKDTQKAADELPQLENTLFEITSKKQNMNKLY